MENQAFEIEPDLWIEFNKVVEETKKYQAEKVSLTGLIKYSTHATFWEHFLNTQFPLGQLHDVLEKNFAVWISLNNIDIEKIKKAYSKNNWSINPLMGWLRGVQTGKILTYNSGEVVQWCRQYNREDLEAILPVEDIGMPRTELRILTDTELSNYEIPKTEWLVENFITPKSINIIGGKRSTAKSWMALALGYCLAEGIPFLDKYNTKKSNVAYLDRENGLVELKNRAPMIKKGLNIEKTLENVFYVSECHFKLDNSIDLQAVEEFIIKNNISLIIADTYRRFIRFEENDATEVSKFFTDMLKPFCERTGVAIILIHHEKKGENGGDDMDMLRGSSDLANYVDSIVQIERKGNKLLVKQTKRRSGKEIEPFNVLIETDEINVFKLSHKGEATSTADNIIKSIISWVQSYKMDKFYYHNVMEFCIENGHKESSVKKALNDMQTKGLIEKGEGKRDPYIVSSDLTRLNQNS